METQNKAKEETATRKEKGWRKWGSRIGHFLMFGGWVVILIVVVGLVLAFSAKC